MNIVVMSPHTGHNGNTTISSLIALELSSRNRKVCLTHALLKSNSLYSYFGIRHIDDKTNNPVQIINLIRGGGIRKNDIGDYCKPVANNLELFSLNSNGITEEQHCVTIDFICNGFPHDYVVFDMDDNDLYSKVSDTIINSCDCIVYVLSQGVAELAHFNTIRQDIIDRIGNIPMLVVVNKYTDIVGSMKDVAASIGIRRANKWYKINYNPWISYGTNKGKIAFIYENMVKKEYHVVDIQNDIKLLVNGIMSVRGILRNRSAISDQHMASGI
jgi:hypothetical protein